MSKALTKNQEILICSKAILLQDTPDLSTLTPYQRHHGRVTVKLPSPVHKSGWRQVTVPISFISDPVDSGNNSLTMTVGQLKKALEAYDESLPVCVSMGIGYKPPVKTTFLEQQKLIPQGYVNLDPQKSELSTPVVALYT
jgi:hypothetical protein